MTREEAIQWIENVIQETDADWDLCTEALKQELGEQKEVLLLALSALRAPTREYPEGTLSAALPPRALVEKVWRGEWIEKPTGRYGQWQTWCSACGEHSGVGGIKSNRHKPFCPNCGAPMTDKAVEMVMERLEALKDGNA